MYLYEPRIFTMAILFINLVCTSTWIWHHQKHFRLILSGMKWSGSSGFWIKQRWLKTLHQSWTIKGQTRFKSLPHHFPEHSSLLAWLAFISVQNIIFLHSHKLFFCSVSRRIFLAHASATQTDCFPSMAVITMSWLRQRLYLPIAMCQPARLEEKVFVKPSKGSVNLTPKSFVKLFRILHT